MDSILMMMMMILLSFLSYNSSGSENYAQVKVIFQFSGPDSLVLDFHYAICITFYYCHPVPDNIHCLFIYTTLLC